MAVKRIYNVSAVYNDPKGKEDSAIALAQEPILAETAKSAELKAIRKLDDKWDDKIDDITFTAVSVDGNFR